MAVISDINEINRSLQFEVYPNIRQMNRDLRMNQFSSARVERDIAYQKLLNIKDEFMSIPEGGIISTIIGIKMTVVSEWLVKIAAELLLSGTSIPTKEATSVLFGLRFIKNTGLKVASDFTMNNLSIDSFNTYKNNTLTHIEYLLKALDYYKKVIDTKEERWMYS